MRKSAIIYFTSFLDHSINTNRWPSTPDEVLYTNNKQVKPLLCYCVEDEEPIKITISRPKKLVEDSVRVVNDCINKGAELFYSVHPKALFLWFYKLHADNSKFRSSSPLTSRRLNSITIDLCEVFYQPRIIDFQTRINFCPDVVKKWLFLSPNTSELEVLKTIRDMAD